jgi:cell division protein ZapA
MTQTKPAGKSEVLSVTVKVMGKEYVVNCPPAEHEALVTSAEHVNERMSAIKKRGRALDAERVAVMAALNLARELLALKGDSSVVTPDDKAVERLRQMGRDIDLALDDPG